MENCLQWLENICVKIKEWEIKNWKKNWNKNVREKKTNSSLTNWTNFKIPGIVWKYPILNFTQLRLPCGCAAGFGWACGSRFGSTVTTVSDIIIPFFCQWIDPNRHVILKCFRTFFVRHKIEDNSFSAVHFWTPIKLSHTQKNKYSKITL